MLDLSACPYYAAISSPLLSAFSSGSRFGGASGDVDAAITSSTKPVVEPSPPPTTTSSTSAISRLTNRFASSASAMGRRALRTALHPVSGGGRQSKPSVSLDQDQLPELDIDSDGEAADEDAGVIMHATADTMPTPQNYTSAVNAGPTPEALITARSQTLPYTAASRERYNKQTVIGTDGTPFNRPSRLRKILLRRRANGGDKEGRSSGGRRNPFRSIFRGSGGGDNNSVKTSALVDISNSTRLYTTSLPPNLASLQPLPLPLHSHSISNINEYRKKHRRRRSSASHKHHRGHHYRRHRHRGEKNQPQFEDIPFSAANLFLQQPLPMPNEGNVYHAPMRDWFTEPFVTNGSLVYSGMWSPTGARSPLVLVLVGEILKSHNKHRVAWRRHMPLLLLCLFLGEFEEFCRPSL